MLFFQVGIENHGEIADEDAAKPSGADFVGIEEDQAIFAEGGEAEEFLGEVAVEVDGELAGDFVFQDEGVAEEPVDYRTTEAVVLGKMIAAHGGDAAFV